MAIVNALPYKAGKAGRRDDEKIRLHSVQSNNLRQG